MGGQLWCQSIEVEEEEKKKLEEQEEREREREHSVTRGPRLQRLSLKCVFIIYKTMKVLRYIMAYS